jgi:hypothetical protein
MQFQNLLRAAVLHFLATSLVSGATLSSARVTEMKNDVRYKTENVEERAAQKADVVKGADVLRTGERSQAELQFDDQSITRLGSKSVFSFKSETREFDLPAGVALICIPKGKGGGRIVTSAITAAIEGTTVLAVGSGKIIFLEGNGRVFTNDGKQSKPIQSGQVARLDSGELTVSDILLEPLLQGVLVTSFSQPLPTWDAIQQANQQQQHDIANGKLRPPAGTTAGAPGPPDVNDPLFQDSSPLNTLRPRQKGTQP